MRQRWISFAAALGLFLLLLLRSAEARAGAAAGFESWKGLLLPALLPWFVAAGWLTRLGLAESLGRTLSPTLGRLLRLSGSGCAVFLLGLTGGYPMGAAAAAEAVKSKRLSRAEGERLLCFCDNTGPGFAVGALGVGVFHSPAWGLFLWGIHAFTALALGLCHRRGAIPPARETGTADFAPGALTAAIRGAAEAMVVIGGNVVFFSAVMGALFPLLPLQGAGPLGRAALAGFLELSGGAAAMEGLPLTPESLALGEFLLSWGGLCVHMQSAAVAAELSTAGRLRGKLLHGVLSAALAYSLGRLLL